MTIWGWYWLLWFTLGFGIPEAVALIWNVRNTLSYQIWGIEKIDYSHPLDFARWSPVHWITGIAVLTFTVWLCVHLVFGIWR